MRLLLAACLIVAAGVSANGALAAPKLPDAGSVVYKDLRSYGVVEARDAKGKLVWSQVDVGETGGVSSACDDPRHTFYGPRWETFEPYLVNVASTPAYLDASAALGDIVAAHEAWQTPFVTDCARPAGTSPYRALYGGTTAREASLADGVTTDGYNVVAFRSLAGTVCDGALACVVVDFASSINEVDMLFEADLTRYGYEDYWTTGDTTWWNEEAGEYALSDMATHEWGHFAGLGHTNYAPQLTMFPFIHDGMQTLGLGDMKGLLLRYR